MAKSLFLASVIAMVTGDKTEVSAIRNEKLAASAIKGQISAQEAEIVKHEMKAESAKEALNLAILSTNSDQTIRPIESAEGYLQAVKNAQDKLDSCKEDLEDSQKALKYWTDMLTEFFTSK